MATIRAIILIGAIAGVFAWLYAARKNIIMKRFSFAPLLWLASVASFRIFYYVSTPSEHIIFLNGWSNFNYLYVIVILISVALIFGGNHHVD
jgi:hypothetical protein